MLVDLNASIDGGLPVRKLVVVTALEAAAGWVASFTNLSVNIRGRFLDDGSALAAKPPQSMTVTVGANSLDGGE